MYETIYTTSVHPYYIWLLQCVPYYRNTQVGINVYAYVRTFLSTLAGEGAPESVSSLPSWAVGFTVGGFTSVMERAANSERKEAVVDIEGYSRDYTRRQ